jgi:hypothetical protein
MKLLLLLGTLVSLAFVSTQAQRVLVGQEFQRYTNGNALPQQSLKVMPESVALTAADIVAPKPYDRQQALTYTFLDVVRFSPVYETINDKSVFAYDPVGRGLYFARTYDVFQDNPNGTRSRIGGRLAYLKSTNGGMRWDTVVASEIPGRFFVYTDIGAITAGSGLNIAMTGLSVNVSDSRFSTSYYYFDDGGAPFSEVFMPPGVNNQENQTFFASGQLLNFLIDGSPYAYIAGRLGQPGGSTATLGSYGHWLYSFDNQDFEASREIPDQWRKSAWYPTTATGFYHSSLLIDTDAEGNMYAANTTPLAGEELATRSPRVSVSNDLGSTWSSFADRSLPATALQQYATARQVDRAVIYDPYTRDGFTVYGDNQFSYIYRIALVNASNQIVALDLVEAAFSNNSWTLRTIAELNSSGNYHLEYNSTLSEQRGSPAFEIQLPNQRQGHEINVAKTADGRHIVALWVDVVPGVPATRVVPPYTAAILNRDTDQYDDVTIDSVNRVDIYGAFRDLSTGGWVVANVSNSNDFEFGIRIPKIVPSVSNIPLIAYRAFPRENINTQYPLHGALNAMPMPIYQRVAAPTGAASYASVNLLTSSVSESTQPTNASIERIVPNPSITGSEITWAQVHAGHVSIKVVNVLGSVVKSVVNAVQDAGQHAVTIDTHDMSAGTYSIVLTVNGSSVTSPLVIVR